jgi:hypothetical protein
MQVSFLYWPDCPSHEKGLNDLRQALNDEGVAAEVEVIEINSQEEAAANRFIGSPTFRINGRDIDPEGEEGQPYYLNCRIYQTDTGRVSPLPTLNQLRQAIRTDGAKENLFTDSPTKATKEKTDGKS